MVLEREREWRSALRGVRALLKYHPPCPRKRRGDLPVGRVRFGCHRGLKLINPDSGFEGGRPIEHYYIEKFLARRIAESQGHVLKSADDFYTGEIRRRPRRLQRRVALKGKQPERDKLALYDSRSASAVSGRRKLVNPSRRPARIIAP
jgi:hypothetical protein